MRYALLTFVTSLVAVVAQAAGPANLQPLVGLLTASDEVEVQRDVLRGMEEAFRGRRAMARPDGWPDVLHKLAVSPDREVRQRVLRLSVLFGDAEALKALRTTALDAKVEAADRQGALQTLIETQAPELLPLLRDLLADPAMRGPAVRGLAAVKDPSTPTLILEQYAKFNEAEKADAVQTLASRPEYARALLDAIEKEQVPRRDLSPFTARQILAFKDKALADRLNAVWGTIRPPAQDKTALLNRYKGLVPPDALKKADRSAGRAVFARTCAACHTLFDAGGKVGPDLTGSQRANPEYILGKVLDPNAVVARDYQVSVVTTKDGRVISGIIKAETDKTLALQTQNEIVNLSKGDIEERSQTKQSIMPEGQLTQLSDVEIRDLIAYLAGDGQVPTKPAPK